MSIQSITQSINNKGQAREPAAELAADGTAATCCFGANEISVSKSTTMVPEESLRAAQNN